MVKEIEVKSVLNKHKQHDDWFVVKYTVNPYYGCSFNCVYCYLRGSKYGEHMSKTLSVKINAPEILDKQLALRAKKNEYGIVGFASQEAYMPIEEKYQVTRKMLEVVLKHRFPVHMLTKSTLILRDLDLLKKIEQLAILPWDIEDKVKRKVLITWSLSTINDEWGRIFEPGAPLPSERLATMQKCKNAGFKVGVAFIPVLPFLTDSEEQLQVMVKAAKDHGADYVMIGGLTLFGSSPTDCRTLYYHALEKHFPDILAKTKKVFDGKEGSGWSYQGNLDKIGRKLCKKYKLSYRII